MIEIDATLRALAGGVDLGPLITAEFGLGQLADAFSFAADLARNAGKLLLRLTVD